MDYVLFCLFSSEQVLYLSVITAFIEKHFRKVYLSKFSFQTTPLIDWSRPPNCLRVEIQLSSFANFLNLSTYTVAATFKKFYFCSQLIPRYDFNDKVEPSKQKSSVFPSFSIVNLLPPSLFRENSHLSLDWPKIINLDSVLIISFEKSTIFS